MKTNKLIQCWSILLVFLTVFGVGNALGATTGTINFGNSGTKINDASISGDDDLDNTWTITTAGTTSYTQSTYYSQVGSSSYPATSITFTMTLGAAQRITAFSADFGGFSDTDGDVSLTVGSTEIGSGSLSGTSDVTISNDISAVGTVLTVSVTNIAKGVKCYSISYTYEAASAQTVTFNKQGGTFDDPSVFINTNQIKEQSAGAGITLPLVNPSSACASEGWGFLGWATSAVASETTTAPTIVGQAGDTYYPTSDITLHAVFAKGEYTKITSGLDNSSKYIFVAVYSTKNYVMTSKYLSKKLKAKQIDESSSGKYNAALIDPSWCYTLEANSSSWHIVDCNSAHTNHYLDVSYADWYGHTKDTEDPYTIAYSTDHWTITSDYDEITVRWFAYSSEDGAFVRSASSQDLQIYKAGTIYYHSTPSCCEYEVSVSESGSSHITSMAFSESSVPTCGDASSRTITITVTPASGYSLFGTTKPVFTKTSGTVTATIGSVTDNGNGTFSYECTFNSNDDGAGTFAISPGQFSNYRTVCCTELGDIDGDVNITTDGCDPGEIKVTWKMEATTGIASQTLKVYDDTPAEVTAKRITSITPSTSNQTKTISGLDPCKEYFVTIENVSSGGAYCAAGTPWESDVITTLGYTYTVNATNCQLKSTSDPVPDDMCEGDVLVYYEATGTSILPDDITVTNAGDEGTGWWWDSSTGELGIDADYVTGDVVVTIFASCADYSFIYGTTKGSENNFECFSFVTGSTDTWLTDLWTIPSADQWTYVGEPSWNPSTGKSANLQLSNMPYALNHANNLGTIGTNRMEGAQGYLKICSNSSDANRYVGFIPAGYVLRWGTDGSGWNSIAFSGKTSAIEEEDWYTPLQTWTSSNADDYTYVGLKTSSGYVWANRSETRRPVFLKPTSAWDHSNAYFAIYYFDASSHTGWSAIMTDPDGDGIYEAWIPNDYTYTTVNFVRLSTDATGWGNKWNQTGDITLPSDKNVFTITGGSGDAYTGSWSLYDKKGTFHISANSNTNNWYCHFLPHHVLHYDANSGSGAPADQTIAVNASPCQLTVSTTEPTRTGYTFAGWNESSSAASKDDDWDGGDTHTMSGDVTLYAVWTPNTNTAYTVKHYKQKLDGTYPASPDDTDNLTGTTGASITPDRKSYTGFTAPSGTTTTILADGSRVVEYQYSRNSYTLAWSLDGGEISVAGTTAGSVKYEASLTAPTVVKTGYTFASWSPSVPSTMPAANSTYTATWTANTNTAYTVKHYKQKLDGTYDASPDDTDNLTGTTGASITPDRKSYTGFTAPSGTTTTILADGSRVVEYQYTRNSYNIAVQTISYVTIKATPTGESAITEGNNADAAYGNTITLNYSSKDSRYTWGGWRVTKADDASVSVCSSTSNNATFSMPAYAVKVTAYLYGDLKAWCDPDVTVTGDIHLTSTKDVPVRYSTSGSDNLVTISSSDMGSATTMEVAYLNADAADAEVDKDDSPFRFYKADGSATTETLDLDHEWETSHPISYTPSAYSVTNNYKLQLNFKKGGKVLKTVTKAIYGRGLPEEFVIAVKKGDMWVALPSNLASTSGEQPSIVPQPITVDNTTTPSEAVYAPTTTVYEAKGRGNDGHISTIRFTTTGSNYLQVSGSDGTYNMWLSTSNSANVQDWQLKSSNNSAYELTIPSTSTTKKMGIYNNTYMGYHGSPNYSNIYFLPITNKYTDVPATVHEWGEHGAIIEANMTNVASATMHVADGSPAAATLTPVNAASLTEGKYVRVYKSDMTVGAVANEGKSLYIHWKNSGGTEIGVSQLTIPTVIAADATMSSIADTKAAWAAKSEVYVLPDVTLDANAGSFSGEGALSVSNLHLYPGATLNVSTGTFNATTLRLHNGWTRAGTKKYDVARVYINATNHAKLTKTTASMDYDIYESGDGQHFYPLAVPFATAIKSLTDSIDYADSYLAKYSKYGMTGHYVIKEYNGARRAEKGPDQANNWTPLAEDATLSPGKGYIISALAVKGEAIIRVPLTYNDAWTADGELGTAHYDDADHTKNVVAVTDYTGTATEGGKKASEGWNLLGVPFMSCYATGEDMGTSVVMQGKLDFKTGNWTEDEIRYVNVPVHDFSEYIQTNMEDDDPVTVLRPGWCFFVQVKSDGNLTFLTAKQAEDSDLPIYAPKREDSPVVKTGIILSNGEKSDKTTLLISDKYSAEYEIGADLEKMFGNAFTLSTYSIMNDTKLAYNALSNAEAQQIIPIGVRIPAEGEYTFSLNPRYAEANIERLDLIDYQTGEITNLMTADYTFSMTQGENTERFALNVTTRKDTPTDTEQIDVGDERTRKLIINDKLYIFRNGRIYDATGKQVSEINK